MFSPPLRKGLRITLILVLVGVAWRFIGAAIDPELKSWALVAVAPIAGYFRYRRETGGVALPPAAMMWLGGGMVLFWIVSIASGGLQITSRVDWLYAAFIVAIPAFLLIMGIWSYRRQRGSASSSSI